MDPVACYREMDDALAIKDFDTANECARSLKDWLNHSGFSPFPEGDWRSRLTHLQRIDFLEWVIAICSSPI